MQAQSIYVGAVAFNPFIELLETQQLQEHADCALVHSFSQILPGYKSQWRVECV